MSWGVYSSDKALLPPLVYSNKKTQESVVDEIEQAIKEGHKIIFVHGKCGSGKSLIGLELARRLGKASVVVPVKYLQKQYEEDYTNKMYLQKDTGEKLKITILTGRNNHQCLYDSQHTADHHLLPCTVEIKKENLQLLDKYLEENPMVDVENFKNIDDIRRVSVAAACPFWSPVINKDWFGNDYGLKDAQQVDYEGLRNRQFAYFRRKPGCTYYAQFMSYITADVLVFNSKKYEIEVTMDRKPVTAVEIIDECDEFLDNFSNEKRFNLDILSTKLNSLIQQCKDEETKEALLDISDQAQKFLRSTTFDSFLQQEKVFSFKNSQAWELLNTLLQHDKILEYEELEPYIMIAKYFEHLQEDTYYTYYHDRKNYRGILLVNVNLEKKFKEFLEKNKVFVLMSGTLHSRKVLETVFGITEFKTITAETKDMGTAKKTFTRLERNFRYKEFEDGRLTKEDYLKALAKCLEVAEKPVLVHVNSYADLPSEEEKQQYNLTSIQSREKLEEQQEKYKQGELLQMFKEGKIPILYSTRCSRGVDFPGDMCRSIVFTKYPYPSMHSLFWKVLKLSRPEHFMDFYFDKARREFLQRVYRGLRFPEDKVTLLSPDMKVLESF
ncbi:MAG TPA: helicase C-terminal domain-containing protein [Candidatus Nanoarchaeia archaeon]|nr:helicase C-terminal domain-containing protein [Candidatus Nanoarchaeia archaeon]